MLLLFHAIIIASRTVNPNNMQWEDAWLLCVYLWRTRQDLFRSKIKESSSHSENDGSVLLQSQSPSLATLYVWGFFCLIHVYSSL